MTTSQSIFPFVNNGPIYAKSRKLIFPCKAISAYSAAQSKPKMVRVAECLAAMNLYGPVKKAIRIDVSSDAVVDIQFDDGNCPIPDNSHRMAIQHGGSLELRIVEIELLNTVVGG